MSQTTTLGEFADRNEPGPESEPEREEPDAIESARLPEFGRFDLVEDSDEQTVWRRTRSVPAGEYKCEMRVFEQFGGWRVKYRYNVGINGTDSAGGYREYDASDSRATFEDRDSAEDRAIEILSEKTFSDVSENEKADEED